MLSTIYQVTITFQTQPFSKLGYLHVQTARPSANPAEIHNADFRRERARPVESSHSHAGEQINKS